VLRTDRHAIIQAFIPPLSPLLLRLGRAPLLAARLTRLACGGCVLGFSFAHIACDGTAAAAFMAAWAQAHHAAGIAGRVPRPAASVPEFSRTALVSAVVAASEQDGGRDAPDVASPAARMAAAVTAAGAVARLAKMGSDFALRRTATLTLRVPAAAAARARARGEAATGERLSVNDVAVGLAWALLRRCRARGPAGAPRLRYDDDCADDQPVQFMTQAADLRRLLPALPASYAGNAVHALLMSGSADDAACPLRAAAASASALRRARESDSADIATQLRASLGISSAQGAATSSSWRAATSAAVVPHFGDGIFSSWYVPALWRLRWGGSGVVRWSYVAVFPAAPWTFGAVAGPPGGDGAAHDLLLMVNVPAGRMEEVTMEAERLLLLAAGPEPGDTEAPPAE
jgi:hypothetical protein